tara:strand:+ start:475 stop:675 length:201 start_codon:yes stop_codon:yes gene_type:complete
MPSYKNAKWVADKSPDGKIVINEKDNISVEIDGIPCQVPTDKSNIHYAEILELVDAGTLTIADAEL